MMIIIMIVPTTSATAHRGRICVFIPQDQVALMTYCTSSTRFKEFPPGPLVEGVTMRRRHQRHTDIVNKLGRDKTSKLSLIKAEQMETLLMSLTVMAAPARVGDGAVSCPDARLDSGDDAGATAVPAAFGVVF